MVFRNLIYYRKWIKLLKIGKVKAIIHRIPDTGWIIKSATVSQDRDGKYYVSILFTFEKMIDPIAVSDHAFGLDYASDGLYTDSNARKGTNYKYFRNRESHSKLAKEQRKLSRMKEGESKI